MIATNEAKRRPFSHKAFAGTASLTVLISAYFAIANLRAAASDDGLTRAFGVLFVGLAGFSLIVATTALVAILRLQAPGERPTWAAFAGIVLGVYFTWLSFVGEPLLLIAAFVWGIATMPIWLQIKRRS
jgi:hypothetical protein